MFHSEQLYSIILEDREIIKCPTVNRLVRSRYRNTLSSNYRPSQFVRSRKMYFLNFRFSHYSLNSLLHNMNPLNDKFSRKKRTSKKKAFRLYFSMRVLQVLFLVYLYILDVVLPFQRVPARSEMFKVSWILYYT